MESRFGYDFSHVRVHTDARAAESARAVNARAYAVAHNIVFGDDQYEPNTQNGRRLIAHELTHTLQQSAIANIGFSPLRIGDSHDTFEHEASQNERSVATSHSSLSSASVQRDLARPPREAPDPLIQLDEAQMQAAIQFNQERFSDPYSIAVIRDVVGISRFPAVVDEELITSIVQWQSERHMTQDGKIGHATTRSFVLELIAERQLRDAVMLIVDSYGLLTTLRLHDIEIGTGPNFCGTAADPADAITSGGVCPPVGGRLRIRICRNSFPPATDYNHFVRIVGHEMVHVPHCGGAALDLDVTEFEAFFFEACGGGRAPNLTPAQRVNHANIALGHFAALAPAAQTPARIAMRNRLNNLIAAGGVGPC